MGVPQRLFTDLRNTKFFNGVKVCKTIQIELDFFCGKPR